MSDDWRDANQVYGCLMVPPPAIGEYEGLPEERSTASDASKLLQRAHAATLRMIEGVRTVVYRAHLAQAARSLHLPRRR